MESEQEPNWYKPSGGTAVAEPPQPAGSVAPPAAPPAGGSVSWTASEYIDHERNASWYLMLVLITAVIAAAVWLITKDYFASGVIPILGIIVGLFARRKPEAIQYTIDESGLKIGSKSYPYSLFKSFSIIREGAPGSESGTDLSSINLTPLKRFMPAVSAYFAAQDEEQIISVIGSHLAHQDKSPDPIDKLTRRLKF
ncbi:hypothetical protein HY380_02505 [Candidatus Saccharibacteria bacterium]|nr:hypothetical protein [Candidatus Saccharibacteria bacterium]